jgi:hypothetical protein
MFVKRGSESERIMDARALYNRSHFVSRDLRSSACPDLKWFRGLPTRSLEAIEYPRSVRPAAAEIDALEATRNKVDEDCFGSFATRATQRQVQPCRL